MIRPAPHPRRGFVLQAALDATVRALETRDFALYLRHNAVPFVLVSDRATVILASEDDLRTNFEDFADLLAGAPGARMTRHVVAEQAVGRCLVQTHVRTEVRHDGRHLVDPFATDIGWRLVDNMWKSVIAANPVRSRHWAAAYLDRLGQEGEGAR